MLALLYISDNLTIANNMQLKLLLKCKILRVILTLITVTILYQQKKGFIEV